MRLLVVVVAVVLGVPASAESPSHPPTRREAVADVLHGVRIVDHYRWLEDQGSAETRAWIGKQNAYTRGVLEPLPVVPGLRERLSQLLRVDDQGMPVERGGRYFYFRKRAADDLSVLVMRRGADGKEEALIDPHPLSADHTTTVTLADVSRDGKLIAYGVRKGGLDEIEVRVRDIDAGRDLTDVLPAGLYRSVSFAGDGRGFYYGRHDREQGVRIYFHRLGEDTARDEKVFGDGYGPDKWIAVEVSENGRYVLFSVRHGWGRSELYVRDLRDGGGLRTVVREIDAAFDAQFAGDALVALTDWKAPKRRIVSIDLADPRSSWKEVVPEGPDAMESFSAVGGRIFVRSLHDVSSRISVHSLEGKALGEVRLPGAGSAGPPRGRWESAEGFYAFESYTQPLTVYRLDAVSLAASVWHRAAVPFDWVPYETRQVWYASKDGTRVPMFIVHRKGLSAERTHPTLLYGYGGFNVSLVPRFRTFFAAWLEQGGVLAVPNLRGGGEFGEAWHRAGMLAKKQNVFDDFIAAAEWLVANGNTEPSKLAIYGSSNGGLLVGAALTQRPELYRAVLCTFPDLDMVRYYQFENNNKPALLEYGNAAIAEQFKFLYAYSAGFSTRATSSWTKPLSTAAPPTSTGSRAWGPRESIC